MENKAKQIIEKFNDHPFSVTSMEGFEMANAYLQLESALESANAEIKAFQAGLSLFEDSIRHSFKEREDKLKSENKKLADENIELKQTLKYRDEDIPVLRETIGKERSENARLRAALEQINREELNTQRPGGGYSRSAKISFEALKLIKE